MSFPLTLALVFSSLTIVTILSQRFILRDPCINSHTICKCAILKSSLEEQYCVCLIRDFLQKMDYFKIWKRYVFVNSIEKESELELRADSLVLNNLNPYLTSATLLH